MYVFDKNVFATDFAARWAMFFKMINEPTVSKWPMSLNKSIRPEGLFWLAQMNCWFAVHQHDPKPEPGEEFGYNYISASLADFTGKPCLSFNQNPQVNQIGSLYFPYQFVVVEVDKESNELDDMTNIVKYDMPRDLVMALSQLRYVSSDHIEGFEMGISHDGNFYIKGQRLFLESDMGVLLQRLAPRLEPWFHRGLGWKIEKKSVRRNMMWAQCHVCGLVGCIEQGQLSRLSCGCVSILDDDVEDLSDTLHFAYQYANTVSVPYIFDRDVCNGLPANDYDIRVWDKQDRKMHVYDLISDNVRRRSDGNLEFKSDHDSWLQGDHPDVVVMKATGLYDAQGRNIFDGDIVKPKLSENDNMWLVSWAAGS
jgi:hypothetical protein